MNTISKVENNTIDMGLEPKPDLLQLVHDDNAAVAELFFQFTQVEDDDEKHEIFEQIRLGLTLHAQLVEELLYPLVVETADEEDQEEAQKLVTEAEAGNYVSSLILDVLNTMAPEDEYFEAKMTILCELTKLQVKREEKEMFDKLRAADIDFEELADEAAERKAELLDAALSTKKSKSKATTKTSAKSGAQRGASKPTAKTTRVVKKAGPSNNKKGSSKKTATNIKNTKKATVKAGNGKGASAKQKTSRSKSSAKTNNKRRSS